MACSSPPVSFAPRPQYHREDPINEDPDSHSCLSSGMYVDIDMDMDVGVDVDANQIPRPPIALISSPSSPLPTPPASRTRATPTTPIIRDDLETPHTPVSASSSRSRRPQLRVDTSGIIFCATSSRRTSRTTNKSGDTDLPLYSPGPPSYRQSIRLGSECVAAPSQ